MKKATREAMLRAGNHMANFAESMVERDTLATSDSRYVATMARKWREAVTQYRSDVAASKKKPAKPKARKR